MASARIRKTVSLDPCGNPYRISYRSDLVLLFETRSQDFSDRIPAADEDMPLKPQPVRLSEYTASREQVLPYHGVDSGVPKDTAASRALAMFCSGLVGLIVRRHIPWRAVPIEPAATAVGAILIFGAHVLNMKFSQTLPVLRTGLRFERRKGRRAIELLHRFGWNQAGRTFLIDRRLLTDYLLAWQRARSSRRRGGARSAWAMRSVNYAAIAVPPA